MGDLTVEYLPGKQNVVADALSRTPRGWGEAPSTEDTKPGGPLEEISVRHTFSTRSDHRSDPVLYEMASALDEDYKAVVTALKEGKLPADLDSSHPAQLYKQNWHLLTTLEMSPESDLIILDNTKLVVPKPFRPRLVRLYHHSHSGFQKMHASLAERFHWPQMKVEVRNHVENCDDCESNAPAGSAQPFREDMDSLATMLPMEQVSADWATLSGKHLHVVRDRASSYIWVKRFPSESLANTVSHLTEIFNHNGPPTSVRSDGGSTYRKGFRKYLKAGGIRHKLEAAYASSSNGAAENAVKLVKSILTKSRARTDAQIQAVIANFNAIARSDGASSASLFHQRPIRLIGTPAAFPALLNLQSEKVKQQKRQEEVRGRSQRRTRQSLFKVGDSVRIKEQEKAGKYNMFASVLEVRDGGLGYRVKTWDSNGIFLRSIRHLKKSHRSPPDDFVLVDHETQDTDLTTQLNIADSSTKVTFSTCVSITPLLTKRGKSGVSRRTEQPASQAGRTLFSLPAPLYEETGKKKFRWRYLDQSDWEKYSVLPVTRSIPTVLRSCLKTRTSDV